MFAKHFGEGGFMDGRQALAQAFDDWYSRSGMNQSQVAAAGGPSTTTQTKVRQSDGPVSRQTLQQLDHVTGWPPGTAARYLSGEPVTAIAAPARLDQVSDDELLNEVRRRLKGESWTGQTRPEEVLLTRVVGHPEPLEPGAPLQRPTPGRPVTPPVRG